jgi:hypothetical protein
LSFKFLSRAPFGIVNSFAFLCTILTYLDPSDNTKRLFPVSYNLRLTRVIGEGTIRNANLNLMKNHHCNHGLICENCSHNGNLHWRKCLTNTEHVFIPKEELY